MKAVLLLALAGCSYPGAEEARRLCAQIVDADVAYWRRCNVPESTISSWRAIEMNHCDDAIDADEAGVRACVAAAEAAKCGMDTLKCGALTFKSW